MLCQEILYGLLEQMKDDGRISDGCLGSVAKFEETGAEYQEQFKQYWDDITGRELDPNKVKIARQEEMAEFRKHGVYVKVPISECWDKTNKAPIGVRWVDINKGDSKSPKYRSRLVAKEFKFQACGG